MDHNEKLSFRHSSEFVAKSHYVRSNRPAARLMMVGWLVKDAMLASRMYIDPLRRTSRLYSFSFDDDDDDDVECLWVKKNKKTSRKDQETADAAEHHQCESRAGLLHPLLMAQLNTQVLERNSKFSIYAKLLARAIDPHLSRNMRRTECESIGTHQVIVYSLSLRFFRVSFMCSNRIATDPTEMQFHFRIYPWKALPLFTRIETLAIQISAGIAFTREIFRVNPHILHATKTAHTLFHDDRRR